MTSTFTASPQRLEAPQGLGCLLFFNVFGLLMLFGCNQPDTTLLDDIHLNQSLYQKLDSEKEVNRARMQIHDSLEKMKVLMVKCASASDNFRRVNADVNNLLAKGNQFEAMRRNDSANYYYGYECALNDLINNR